MSATDDFFDAWSITCGDARLEAIASAMAVEHCYIDPRTPEPLTSATALAEYVGAFIEAAPDATAKVVKSDFVHGMQRVTVAFTMANGMVQHGQYFIKFSDGRICEMTGFVGTGAVA